MTPETPKLGVLTGSYHPAFVDALARRLYLALHRPADGKLDDAVGSVVGGLYLRIVIMQSAVIFGAMAARRFGTPWRRSSSSSCSRPSSSSSSGYSP